MAWPAYTQALDQGLFAIDTAFHRDHFDAAYLVVNDGQAAFIDTGTNHAVPRLLATLAAVGLAPEAVRWVIPTHVHLDHAGGVGLLMQQLPQAQVLVHPRGVRHLVDPSVLYQGALAVYGPAEMERSYGQLVAVPAARVQASHEGQQVAVGQRLLALTETPGHARHHHAVWDEATRGWFTGDTFGLSYREFDSTRGPWLLPTSTPVQFEPEVLVATIERLLARQPDWLYLTHFSRIGGPGQVQRLGVQLLALLRDMVAMARAVQRSGVRGPARHRALQAGQLQLFAASLREHGSTWPEHAIAELLSVDLELNAQGMAIWLDKEAPEHT
jgi:glyoxylase-like metal-dependent hydrolase (beta-lactamase superfamily II)